MCIVSLAIQNIAKTKIFVGTLNILSKQNI